MTSFERSGYWRTSKHGYQHWVSQTTVHRYDWDRSSNSYTAPQRDFLLERNPELSDARRFATCFVKPNATCPVCKANVYYYQNQHGSRVFFDDIVPPWPKHPCTDSRLSQFERSDTFFQVRTQPAIAEIARWQKERSIDCISEFNEVHGHPPWPLAIIVKRMKSRKQVFLILRMLKQKQTTSVYVSCHSLPKCCQVGFVIAVGKRKLSLLDTATMAPIEVTIKRHRASQFLDAMSEFDSE